ncbi:exported hypothetical protein [uncultured Defluviicoccus sp.]|uniref:Uncharacterized protein n=1 Tax=metagenome TaxID=256318 RepID=A0A380TEG7_9ZZZZ|nr:exported hypothetical protein [uncultured Defluviicoccus sp.]
MRQNVPLAILPAKLRATFAAASSAARLDAEPVGLAGCIERSDLHHGPPEPPPGGKRVRAFHLRSPRALCRRRLPVAAGDPEDVALAFFVLEAGEDEQVVGEAVDVADGGGVDRFVLGQLAHQALSASGDGAAKMQVRGRGRAALQKS